MVLASDAAEPPSLPVVVSVQALAAIVAQPFSPTPTSSVQAAPAVVVINRQSLPAKMPGVSVIATDAGQNSINQAAVSIHFTLTPSPAAKPAR